MHWHGWFGDKKKIQPVKSWDLVCWCWQHSIVGRTLVSASKLSLSCARLLAGWVTALWFCRPLPVSQHGQLSLPSLWGRLMNSNPCYSGLRRQTAEGVVRGVAYRPRQRVLLATRLECRLAAGSRPRNGDERRSLALWAVREPTSHWGWFTFTKAFTYTAWLTEYVWCGTFWWTCRLIT